MNTKMSFLVMLSSVFALSGLTCPSDCSESNPNPAVDRIDFTLVSTTSATQGMVKIDGVVENKGGGMFDSNPGQQSVQLFEGTTMVAEQIFEDLAPSAMVTVSFTKNWDTTNEFPPTYRAIIVYDPDIFIDGNEGNDDCATSDNVLERSGTDINALFP
ncbi:MAG: hypothetical protein ACE5EQ_03260 [Phycisphaerae bacterium]